jgi:hypothetical protein
MSDIRATLRVSYLNLYRNDVLMIATMVTLQVGDTIV